MKKTIIFASLLIFFSSINLASAHVVVKPAEVGVGAFQTFYMGVPSEKELSTVGLKLIIPDGLAYVSPNVKPGWQINIIKEGTGEDTKVTAIEWYGGIIPPSMRDDFYFSAKVPASSTIIQWKAYQTYSDGSIVSWDHDPAENITDFSTTGPYSKTMIVDDLSTSTSKNSKTSSGTALTFSLVALALSVIALSMSRKNKNSFTS